jgi:hypothetical protein
MTAFNKDTASGKVELAVQPALVRRGDSLGTNYGASESILKAQVVCVGAVRRLDRVFSRHVRNYQDCEPQKRRVRKRTGTASATLSAM